MKHSRILSLCMLCAVIATAAAIYQMLVFTEAATGFFIPRFSVAGWIVTAVIGLLTVCIWLVASEQKSPAAIAKPSLVLGIISVVFAAFFVYEAFSSAFIAGQIAPVTLLIRVLCCLSVPAVLYLGFVPLSKNTSFGFLTIFPLFYSLIRLVLPFVRYSNIPTISQNVYELAFLCFQLLFWLYAAMLACGINRKTSAIRLYPISFMAAVIGCCTGIPKIIAGLIHSDTLHEGSLSPYVCVTFGVFAAAYAISLFVKKSN